MLSMPVEYNGDGLIYISGASTVLIYSVGRSNSACDSITASPTELPHFFVSKRIRAENLSTIPGRYGMIFWCGRILFWEVKMREEISYLLHHCRAIDTLEKGIPGVEITKCPGKIAVINIGWGALTPNFRRLMNYSWVSWVTYNGSIPWCIW